MGGSALQMIDGVLMKEGTVQLPLPRDGVEAQRVERPEERVGKTGAHPHSRMNPRLL